MATESKTARFIKKIGTHSGVFHCDEALACFMLKQLPEYLDADIVRSRDSDVSLYFFLMNFYYINKYFRFWQLVTL